MIKKFESYTGDNEGEWIECPSDHNLSIGDTIRISKSSSNYQLLKDMNGTIVNIIAGGYARYTILWANNLRGSHRKDELLIRGEVKPIKIKWYRKGKLEENKLFENENNIGRKVIGKNNPWADYTLTWQEQKNNKKIGKIIDYYPQSKSYLVRWNKHNTEVLLCSEVEFLNDIEIEEKPRIKWYKKGRLHENESHEYDDYIGRRVKIFVHFGPHRYGKIISYASAIEGFLLN